MQNTILHLVVMSSQSPLVYEVSYTFLLFNDLKVIKGVLVRYPVECSQSGFV